MAGVVYDFPKTKLIRRTLAESRRASIMNAQLSGQLSLLNQARSHCAAGSLIVIPIGGRCSTRSPSTCKQIASTRATALVVLAVQGIASLTGLYVRMAMPPCLGTFPLPAQKRRRRPGRSRVARPASASQRGGCSSGRRPRHAPDCRGGSDFRIIRQLNRCFEASPRLEINIFRRNMQALRARNGGLQHRRH